MLRILKDQRGFTLIELVIIIILIAVLAGVAIPRFVNLRDEAVNAKAKAIQDGARAGIMLNFADEILKQGTYSSGLSGNDVLVTGGADLTAIHGVMEDTPGYPPSGTYGGTNCPTTGFCWYITDAGGASTPASIYGLYNNTDVDSL